MAEVGGGKVRVCTHLYKCVIWEVYSRRDSFDLLATFYNITHTSSPIILTHHCCYLDIFPITFRINALPFIPTFLGRML